MLWTLSKNFTPPFDVIESGDQITVLVEIAGMQSEDFSINLMNRHLIISGTRRRPPVGGTAYHRVEIGFGEFRLDIPLPWTVEQDKVNAVYREGFLQIDLPRRAEQHIPVAGTDKQVNTAERDKSLDDQ